ncbi:MAG: hypothetical protein EHM13_15480 [Acidobacteria bacterium]|nr:MAG: hypothetical protein EHM13_15480 [Acidobacteriota bacterium]
MYSRPAALTVLERIRRLDGGETLTADRARELAGNGGPHLLVTEQNLALPVAYRNGRFRVYRLE